MAMYANLRRYGSRLAVGLAVALVGTGVTWMVVAAEHPVTAASDTGAAAAKTPAALGDGPMWPAPAGSSQGPDRPTRLGPSAEPEQIKITDPKQLAKVKRGEYLMRAGDCIACHSVAGGKPLSGGLPMVTPFGTIYTPNITPDDETGIGKWTEKDLWNAIHNGINRHGEYLYPAFPFTSYTKVSKEDVSDIYAYLRSVKPVKRKNTPLGMAFPFNQREALLGWRMMFFDKGEFKPNPKKSKEWNRGAYLVEGLGHCGECHTQRNALGGTEKDEALAGGMIPIQNWYAPNLSTAPHGGLEGWTEKDIVDLLKTGRSSKGTVYGPMAEVVQDSMQYMTDADLKAIAVYLKSLPPQPTKERGAVVEPPEALVDEMVHHGKDIYEHKCARCHQSNGNGVEHIYPPLNGNASVLAPNPVNPIRIVLLGGFEVTTQTYPRPFSMPPFAQDLSDKDVASVVTYIRQAWSNKASPVSPQTVRKYRSNDGP
ncbi:cytochrome c [Oleiagrimonas sp. C23AA]|uniref:c-type cytochrome n=1 Tax=Oleiagrimonas sp. C23AA TaxID=2719047 RepID=UPI00142333D6|nr:cytochrome c [Oleiagrimonas sp. C23AA]NII11638.1 c-type cytochrome [Oleiagrimonas sp. C23AA]